MLHVHICTYTVCVPVTAESNTARGHVEGSKYTHTYPQDGLASVIWGHCTAVRCCQQLSSALSEEVLQLVCCELARVLQGRRGGRTATNDTSAHTRQTYSAPVTGTWQLYIQNCSVHSTSAHLLLLLLLLLLALLVPLQQVELCINFPHPQLVTSLAPHMLNQWITWHIEENAVITFKKHCRQWFARAGHPAYHLVQSV